MVNLIVGCMENIKTIIRRQNNIISNQSLSIQTHSCGSENILNLEAPKINSAYKLYQFKTLVFKNILGKTKT